MKKTFYFLLLFLTIAAGSFAQKYEAESALLAGGASIIASSTASGGYYVSQGEGNLTFNLTLAEEASYNIYIQVASPNGIKANNLVVDGNTVTFNTSLNSSYIHLKAVSFLRLTAGVHTIQITKSWGWINVDFIELEKVDPLTRFNINKTLVTPEPTDEVVKLYQFLLDNYGKKIISGVMDMADAEWLKTNTGKYPALVGLDFMQTGRGYSSWYNDDTPFLEAKAWYERNGIPAMCWHWRDPSHKTEAFYTADTPFDVSKIFDETSDEYKDIIKDIDYTAGLLKKFQDNKIPILWRPLHEAAGGWFWWGAKGAAPCKKLYQIMYDRMVNYHGLHNLIWVWTHEPNDDAWYPGDEYVDIIGRDIYRDGDHGSQILEFNDMNNRYGSKKIITISESGSFPDPDNLIKDDAVWSYFMPWYGNYVRDPKYNSLDLWKKTFASDYVLTLDEMPNLKIYTTPPAFAAMGPYCEGATMTELPTTSTNGISGTWSPVLNNLETTEYIFTPTSGQSTNSTAKITVTINPPTIPTFATVGPYCLDAMIAELLTTSINGFTGSWTPAINNSATTEYTFTPTAGQCAATTTLLITIVTDLTPDFDSKGPYCVGSIITPFPTTSLNGISGTWSPAINNRTTTVYTFTPILACARSVSILIEIDPLITPTFAPVGSYCTGALIAMLPTTSLNGYNGLWSPNLNNTATTEYTFTPTAGQCAAITKLTITIDPKVIPTFVPVGSYCTGATIATLPTTSLNGISGTWSPALNNSATTIYTFTPTSGQCATKAMLTLTINSKVAPTFKAIGPYYEGATIVELPTTSLNNITGSWSPDIDNTVTTTYTFTPDEGQCSLKAIFAIVIKKEGTGIEVNTENNSFKVFPTCFENQINISSDKAIQTISIYNPLGVKIKTVNPKDNKAVISLEGFASGTYMVKVDKQAAIKVIKR